MESIILAIVGVGCIIVGISSRKGNVSSLYSYRRKRVSEKDKQPFGKMMGLGMIMIGIALILLGALYFAINSLQPSIYLIIVSSVLIVDFVIGVGISLYAMIKYNKGFF